MILAKEIQDRINALRDDNTGGATALARVAGQILTRVADLGRSVPADELRTRIVAAGKAVVNAQPAMAPVYNLVNHVLTLSAGRTEGPDLAERIREQARTYLASLVAAAEAAARRAATLVGDGAVVVTHSRSSLVENALLEAHHRGRAFSVVCTESRPLAEGHGLAERLATQGIATTLVIDAAAASFIKQGALVVVGADALSADGLVNKIGTRMLALAAHSAGVPFIVVATTQRFLPPTVPLSYQQLRNPGEIVPAGGVSYAAVNLYFDRTPLNEITLCVTESAILHQKELVDVLSAWRVEGMIDLDSCG